MTPVCRRSVMGRQRGGGAITDALKTFASTTAKKAAKGALEGVLDNKQPKRRKRRRTTKRRGRKPQKGGLLPLAALIPALIAGGKIAAAGALSGAAGYGAKKGLEALARRRR